MARRRTAKPVPGAPRVDGVAIRAPLGPRHAEILTPAALRFLAELHREFKAAVERLLAGRVKQQPVDAATPQESPAAMRGANNHIEIIGPLDRKRIIGSLTADVDGVLIEFARGDAPTSQTCVEGQINLKDRWRRKRAALDGARAPGPLNRPVVFMVRPRDWQVREEVLAVDGAPISASLFDFGLYVFHNAKAQIAAGSRPRLYLPSFEAPNEARLWNDVLAFAQERLALPAGAIRATARIDEFPAHF